MHAAKSVPRRTVEDGSDGQVNGPHLGRGTAPVSPINPSLSDAEAECTLLRILEGQNSVQLAISTMCVLHIRCFQFGPKAWYLERTLWRSSRFKDESDHE